MLLNETTIPVRNLYYLLCYAWDRLDELDLIDAGAIEPPKDALNLLGRVLASGVRALIRKGFERGYREQETEVLGIRGRISLSPTVRKQLPRYGRAICLFDELEYDTPANRIIRATLTLLARSSLVEQPLREELIGLRRHFREVREIRVKTADCRRVVIHRNNRHYDFLLQICEMILESALPDETGRGGKFRDFTRDHQAMARLFEDFIRNFCRHHRDECGIASVDSRKIKWAGAPDDEASAKIWPEMRTDICLRRLKGPPLVVDCKFYSDPLQRWHETGSLRSSHIYQLFTYVQNLSTEPDWNGVSGLLIYPQTEEEVDVGRTAIGVHLRAATVDLNAEWPIVHRRLLAVLAG